MGEETEVECNNLLCSSSQLVNGLPASEAGPLTSPLHVLFLAGLPLRAGESLTVCMLELIHLRPLNCIHTAPAYGAKGPIRGEGKEVQRICNRVFLWCVLTCRALLGELGESRALGGGVRWSGYGCGVVGMALCFLGLQPRSGLAVGIAAGLR